MTGLQIRRIVEGEDMPRVGERQTLLFSATFPKVSLPPCRTDKLLVKCMASCHLQQQPRPVAGAWRQLHALTCSQT